MAGEAEYRRQAHIHVGGLAQAAADPYGGHAEALGAAQVFGAVLDEDAAGGLQAMILEQVVEGLQAGLGVEAHLLHRVHTSMKKRRMPMISRTASA